MKKGMQPTVFIAILVLLLTLMVLESDSTKQNINRPSTTQK
jgi:hypothetical protein